jgi:hypothetical protein
MRFLVLALAALAGAKVWMQDTMFRSGAEEALVAAYRERAIEVCQKQGRDIAGQPMRGLNWSRPTSVRMITGSRHTSVYFWQVDDAAWNARYRNPYLVLRTSEHDAAPSCEYDLIYGQAQIVRS